MAATDSKQKLLNSAEAIARAVEADRKPRKPLPERLIDAAMDTSAPNTLVTQAGNTVFVAHPAGDNTKQMLGTIYNADTAKNYPKNVMKYFDYLQKSGVTHYRVVFDDMLTLNTLKMLRQVLKPRGFEIGVLKSNQIEAYLGMVRIKRVA